MVNYKKFYQPLAKYIILYLCLTALEPIIAEYYGIYMGDGYNWIVINVFLFVRFMFFFILYYANLKRKLFKNTVLVFGLLYLLSLLGEIWFGDTNYHSQSQVVPYVVGAYGVWLSIILYFIEILDSKEYIRLEKTILFWVSLAYFFYFIGFILLKINQETLISNYVDYYIAIVMFLTLLMNVILIIGILWSRPREKQ